MLKSITISNFALIENLELELSDGLIIITGETGAGKSIIVDAIMMLLGDRASTDYIRHGATKSVIEGIFDIPDNHPANLILSDNEIESIGNEIILRREISSKGNSRCFINDSPVQVGILKKLGELIVDFHGQHEHQSLLKEDNHISILDSIGQYQLQLNEYKQSYFELQSMKNELNKLIINNSSIKSILEDSRIKLNEIKKVNPLPEEIEILESEEVILSNAEYLFEATSDLYSLIYSSENSTRDTIIKAEKLLGNLSAIDKQFEPYVREIHNAVIIFNEISDFVRDYHSKINFNPVRIEEIRARLYQLKALEKKYGKISSILHEKSKLEENISRADNFDTLIDELKETIELKRIEAGKKAIVLSSLRIKHGNWFAERIEDSLRKMGIPNAKFDVKVDQILLPPSTNADFILIDDERIQINDSGMDRISFYVSANKGIDTKPIADIASGGEISRIMLAIKSIISKTDYISIMIFDEIDSGISGRIAQKVGELMSKLASEKQIIAITHLPQIAAFGNININIRKFEENSHTFVKAKILTPSEKIEEIAKLLSGEEITNISRKGAQELIKSSKK